RDLSDESGPEHRPPETMVGGLVDQDMILTGKQPGQRAGRAYHRLVGTASAHGLVVAGREAVRAGDFGGAARCLEAALAIEPSPEAYDTLACLGYIDDDFEEARRLWELAYHGYLAAGDLRSAGLAAVYLAGT